VTLFGIESRRAGGSDRDRRPTDLPPAGTKVNFTKALVCGAGAILSLGAGSALGSIHGHALEGRLLALFGALGFLVLGVVAVQSVASTLYSVVVARAGKSGGNAVKVITSFLGYVFVVFVTLGLLAVPVQHLLLGGALTGVIVGIAAQQALGNVFAGLVLLMARPFSVGERVRVRSGALGGPFEGVVSSMSLVYVTLDTDEGPIKLPNSSLLAAGVGPAPEEGDLDLAVVSTRARPVELPDGLGRDQTATRPLARAARIAISSRRSR